MRILITDSSGTIGTRLGEELLPYHEVDDVDIKSNSWLPELNEKTLRVDLRNPSGLATLPDNYDMVIHLAANARVYEPVKSPQLALDNMVTRFVKIHSWDD